MAERGFFLKTGVLGLGGGETADGKPILGAMGRYFTPGPDGKGMVPYTGSAGAAGSSAGGSSSAASFAPGQSARFTPDPTVNGPWTHTRADIPLFRQAGGSSTPATGGLPTNAVPGLPSIPSNTPPPPTAPERKPGSASTWSGSFSSWRNRPKRDRRTMLADALEGK